MYMSKRELQKIAQDHNIQFNSIQYLLVQLFSKNKHGKLSCSHEMHNKKQKQKNIYNMKSSKQKDYTKQLA